MLLNLDKIFFEEIQNVTTKMETNGWQVVDNGVVTKRVDFIVDPMAKNKNEILLVMSHTFLSFIYKNEYYTTPWIQIHCRCASNLDESCLKNTANFIKEAIISITNLMPFYDEDAKFGYFSYTNSKYSCNEKELSLYINPDFPKGWWENHTL